MKKTTKNFFLPSLITVAIGILSLCCQMVEAKPQIVNLPALDKKEMMSGKISQTVKKIDNKEFHVARVLLKTQPEHVWKYLTDYSKAPEVFTNLNKIKLIDQKANKKKVAFQVSSLGGLMKFDYVLHITEDAPHHIEWQRASGAFKRNDGFWILEPVMNGRYTLVTYGKHLDGGLLMPKMLVDKQLKGTMAKILDNLRVAVNTDHKRIAAAK